MLSDADRYRILKRLESCPNISQRALADELGISLGKINYCLNALIERGLLKVENFRNNQHKRAYMYYLTPSGIEEKARVTLRFLASRLAEYEALDREIAELRREVVSVSDFSEAQVGGGLDAAELIANATAQHNNN